MKRRDRGVKEATKLQVAIHAPTTINMKTLIRPITPNMDD